MADATLIRLAHRLPQRRGVPRLALVTESAPLDRLTMAFRQLPRGAAVLFRHYDAPDRAALAKAVQRRARARGLIFILAGDAKLALCLHADGFHAPEALAREALAFRRQRPGAIVTVAAHGLEGLIAAQQIGASAVLLSPVFPTRSHPGAPGLGAVRFAAFVRQARLPVIALGGIDGRTAQRLAGAGCAGFAAISALMGD